MLLRRPAVLGGLTLVGLLLMLPACEGNLAVEALSHGQTQRPGGGGSPPSILPDTDAGPGEDAGGGALPTPLDPPTCTPDCQGRQCGPDGCGGVCGACAEGSMCNASFQCELPEPPAPDVTLYGASWCGYCQQAKRFFQDHDVEFLDRDLDEPGVVNEAADRVQELTGRRQVTTPTIIVGEHVVFGWGESEVRSYLGI